MSTQRMEENLCSNPHSAIIKMGHNEGLCDNQTKESRTVPINNFDEVIR